MSDDEVKALEKCIEIAKASNFKGLLHKLTMELRQLQKREKLAGTVIVSHLRQLAHERYEETLQERKAAKEATKEERERQTLQGNESSMK